MAAFNPVADNDSGGDISYSEFVHEIYKMKSSDSRTQLTFIKYYVAEILKQLKEEIHVLKDDVLARI